MASKSPKSKTAKPKSSASGKSQKGKSRWGKYLKRLAITLAVLYVVICAGMYFFQEKLLFHPVVQAADAAWDLDLEDGVGLEKAVEELNFDAALDGKVNALYFKRDSAKGVILYLHGNGGNAGLCSRGRNQFLQLGWEVCVPDYRGYGKSTGPLSQDGIDADVEAAWKEVAKRYPASQIIIYGQSLGSGFATRLAAKHTPRVLILEAPYTSLKDVAASQYPWLPTGPLLRYPSPSREYIGKVNCPVYVFHGTADQVIPYTQGEEMANTAQKGELITLVGNGHLNVQTHETFRAALPRLLR
jgi:uncharacterized protein